VGELLLVAGLDILDLLLLLRELQPHGGVLCAELDEVGLAIKGRLDRRQTGTVLEQVGPVVLVTCLERRQDVKPPLQPALLDRVLGVRFEVLELGLQSEAHGSASTTMRRRRRPLTDLDHALLIIISFEVLGEEERVCDRRLLIEDLDNLPALLGRLAQVVAGLDREQQGCHSSASTSRATRWHKTHPVVDDIVLHVEDVVGVVDERVLAPAAAGAFGGSAVKAEHLAGLNRRPPAAGSDVGHEREAGHVEKLVERDRFGLELT
jgi:hypothetical protein